MSRDGVGQGSRCLSIVGGDGAVQDAVEALVIELAVM
jgi:hypothetical protein